MPDYPMLEVNLTSRVAPATDHWREIDELREQHRFFWNTYGPGYWVLTQYDDIREAFQNPEVFCNHSIVPTDPDPAYRFLPSYSDPPQHMKYRHLMNRWFAPAAVAKLAPAIEALARETIEPLVAAGAPISPRRSATSTRSRSSCSPWAYPRTTPTSSSPASGGCRARPRAGRRT